MTHPVAGAVERSRAKRSESEKAAEVRAARCVPARGAARRACATSELVSLQVLPQTLGAVANM